MSEYLRRKHMMRRFAASILLIGSQIASQVDNHVTATFARVHKRLAKVLRSVHIKYAVVIVPRGHAKTTVSALFFVLWHLFFEDYFRALAGKLDTAARSKTRSKAPAEDSDEPDPFHRRPKFVVLYSKSSDEASKRLQDIKDVLGDRDTGKQSTLLRWLVGDYGWETAPEWGKKEIRLKDGTVLVSMGRLQSGRGLKRGARRPTLIICDDVESEQNTKTDEAVTGNFDFVLNTLVPAVEPKEGRVIVIGTPLPHLTQCLVTELATTEGWEVVWFQNDAEANRSSEYRPKDPAADSQGFVHYEGVLWEEHVSREHLLKLKAMYQSKPERGGLRGYYHEMEAKQIGGDLQLYRVENERYWEGELLRDLTDMPYLKVTHRGRSMTEMEKLETPELLPVIVAMGCDPGRVASRTSDPTAIVYIAKTASGHIYVAHYYQKKISGHRIKNKLNDLHQQFQPEAGLVETIGSEHILPELYEDFGIRYMPDNTTTWKGDGAVRTKKRKRSGEGTGRLDRLEHPHAAHKLHLQTHHVELRDEMRRYPAGSDDLLDALEKADRIIRRRRPSHSVIIDKTRYDEMQRSKRRRRKRSKGGSWKTA